MFCMIKISRYFTCIDWQYWGTCERQDTSQQADLSEDGVTRAPSHRHGFLLYFIFYIFLYCMTKGFSNLQGNRFPCQCQRRHPDIQNYNQQMVAPYSPQQSLLLVSAQFAGKIRKHWRQKCVNHSNKCAESRLQGIHLFRCMGSPFWRLTSTLP